MPDKALHLETLKKLDWYRMINKIMTSFSTKLITFVLKMVEILDYDEIK